MDRDILRKRLMKWLEIILSAGTLLFAWRTLHDMQTAEGTGLYLAILAGSENRRMYDLLVEGVGMCSLLVLLLGPCILFRRLKPDSFFRLMASYLAFLPTLSTAALVHLLDGTDEILLRSAVSEMLFGDALLEGVAGVVPALAAGIPLLLLTVSVWKTRSEKQDDDNMELTVSEKRFVAIIAVIQFLLLIPALLFPILTDVCSPLIRYIFLLCAFWLWERLFVRYPAINVWGWIAFGIFWLRGIERMLEVMSVYHI